MTNPLPDPLPEPDAKYTRRIAAESLGETEKNLVEIGLQIKDSKLSAVRAEQRYEWADAKLKRDQNDERRVDLEGYRLVRDEGDEACRVSRVYDEESHAVGPGDIWKRGKEWRTHLAPPKEAEEKRRRVALGGKAYDAAREAWIQSLDEEAKARKKEEEINVMDAKFFLKR